MRTEVVYSSPMKLYRLEHSKTGLGPYITLGGDSRCKEAFGEGWEMSEEIDFLRSLFRRNCFSSDHVEVQEDIKGFHAGMLCATDTLEAFFDWFGGINPLRWERFGFNLIEVEVHEECILYGERQVAYHPADVVGRNIIPITRELWVEHR